ncbi:MAG: type I DNA topoisomerase [Lachnospiraceae bacterium]|nr:type I DNA topoisomerase [Lachnospiraceae bacterium]
MANNLIIVESPAKVKTIKKYLGSNYSVDASQGHVRDLPKSRLGIKIEDDYDPEYITIRGKGELLSKLRKEAKAADKIYLATDPDREGEAISWHLLNALNLDPEKKVYRISFNEITKNAIKESLKHPREINRDLVDAQQARRVLDRMVGYSISPLLWDKIKRGLSAGRVQSVALKMICDREKEISEFIPQEYWTIDAELSKPNSKKNLKAVFYGNSEKKIDIQSRTECDEILNTIKDKDFVVKDISSSTRYRKAPLPFTTSTLQQEAGKTLNLGTSKTMMLAQQLYEGVNISGKGNVALITYLRTDSTRISDEADKAVKSFISEAYGDNYVNRSAGSTGKTGTNIQDAHEAIRPTDVNMIPSELKDLLPRDLFRLYQLIWKRFVASRMKPAEYSQKQARISVDDYIFNINSSVCSYKGFLSVYNSDEDRIEEESDFGVLKSGQVLKAEAIIPIQHFTQPPAHYTESSLVKALEDQGIGRPSTYAPTISTILARHYITKEKKYLYVTELGQVVNDVMARRFPDIVDLKFTANMEKQLDDVAEGNLDWKEIVRKFYPDLDRTVAKARKELENVTIADEETGVVCENCGRKMVIKYGPHGKFLACPGFPECRNTKPYLERTGIKCPQCGADIVIRKTRKGRIYYGCENNPECDYMSWKKPESK